MRQYLVFRWNNFYPRGGWDDLLGSTLTIAEAEEMIRKSVADECYMYGQAQIVDARSGEVVRRFDIGWQGEIEAL